VLPQAGAEPAQEEESPALAATVEFRRAAATGTARSRGAGTGDGRSRRARGYGLRSAGEGGGFGMFARGLRPEPMTASARSSIGASAEKSAGVATAVQAG